MQLKSTLSQQKCTRNVTVPKMIPNRRNDNNESHKPKYAKRTQCKGAVQYRNLSLDINEVFMNVLNNKKHKYKSISIQTINQKPLRMNFINPIKFNKLKRIVHFKLIPLQKHLTFDAD